MESDLVLDPVEASASPLVNIPDGADPAEVADMEFVANAANSLVGKVPAFGQLLASMLAARQLYAMCLYELELLMKTTDFSEFAVTPSTAGLTERQSTMLREVLVSAAAAKAQEPFDETVLFTGMTQTVFPWMQRVVAEHTTQQDAERQARYEENEVRRLATPLKLGLPGCENLSRKDAVLLVGEAHVLRWVAQAVTEQALREWSGVAQTVRLTETAPKITDPRLVSVPLNVWANSTRTNVSFQRVYEEFLPQLTNPVDLLVVDNLLGTQSGAGFVTEAGMANEAQKHLHSWTTSAGALLVSCLSRENGLTDFPEQTVKILRQHNRVCEVTTRTTDELVTILVNEEPFGAVPKEELDTYKISLIVKL